MANNLSLAFTAASIHQSVTCFRSIKASFAIVRLGTLSILGLKNEEHFGPEANSRRPERVADADS